MGRKINFSDEQIQEMVELYEGGMSVTKLASNFGVDRRIIDRQLCDKTKLRTQKESVKKYCFNEDFFEKIDTEEKAYFLGLLAADGCVDVKRKRVFIGLKESDKEILEKFRFSLGDERVPIRTVENKGDYGTCVAAHLMIYSSKIVSDLLNCGIGPRKSLTLQFPHDSVLSEFKRDFIRGYFDGDGFLWWNKKRVIVGFCGSMCFLSKLQDYLCNLLKVNRLKIKPDKSIYDIRWSSMEDVGTICDYLYEDAEFFLERKFDSYCKMCDFILGRN